MRRARFRCLVLLWCGASPLLTGCVALSLGIGGKTERVVSENPETQGRLDKLEARVQALEQYQLLPPPIPSNGGPALTP